MTEQTRIGVVGTGFIGRGIVMALENQPDLAVSHVLTNSDISKRSDFPGKHLLTNSVDELISGSDLIVECSGEAVSATYVVDRVIKAGLPVVTMDAELQVTTGSYFAKKGFITEAEGDQPGCLAALDEEARQMGFTPRVYGNVKGYLNLNPTIEDMRFWSQKQGISIDKTTAFTDGTKVQIEQALVANGLGARIIQDGMLGPEAEDIQSGGLILAEAAKKMGAKVSDYILAPGAPAGVFIVAEHEERLVPYLRYYKMGEGPWYTLVRNFHLCHLEVLKTVRRVLDGGEVLLNNSTAPTVSVGAIAKRDLEPGYVLKRGIGSFDIRGTALSIADNPKHVPIALLTGAVLTEAVKAGSPITFDDVEVPASLACDIWLKNN
jgi:predicted homoserine dehydrogenase-like protein